MKSYVVRIYQRNGDKRSQITGTVESAEQGTRKAFHNLMELWAVLASDDVPREAISAAQIGNNKKVDFIVQV